MSKITRFLRARPIFSATLCVSASPREIITVGKGYGFTQRRRERREKDEISSLHGDPPLKKLIEILIGGGR
jgi:hypothetical protein